MNIFEIVDKKGRKIRLTKDGWSHIRRRHAPLENWEDIEKTLLKPIKKIDTPEKNKSYYYSYFKHWKSPNKYLKVIVKYLNGRGNVISAYPVKHLR